jgi:Domain of unknown function (DUF4262)
MTRRSVTWRVGVQTAGQSITIQAGQFYGTEEYPVQQVLIPDPDGRFPGDPNCQPPYCRFPVLARVKH